MEEWRSWAITFCAVAIVCGLSDVLLPQGRIEKSGKLLFSLLLLSVLFSPFCKKGNFFWKQQQDWDSAMIFEQGQANSQIDDLTYSIAEDHILGLVKTKLEERGIQAESVDIRIMEENRIIQMEADLCFSSEQRDREEEIRSLFSGTFGVDSVQISWREEESNGA